MGKGGGQGRGKGGCECCETIHALACCLCLVLFGGPILIAVGATLIAAANRNERARGIDSVQVAANAWNDASSPNGWLQFQDAVIYANLTSTQSGCNPSSWKLQANVTKADRYWDEERFNSVPQLRLNAIIGYSSFNNCYPQVTLIQQRRSGPNGTLMNVTLIELPAMLRRTLDYSILLDKAGGPKRCTSRNDGCYTSNADNCRHNCEDYFYGRWSCSGGTFTCSVTDLYYNDLAVKVSRSSNGSSMGSYSVDSVYPGVGGGGNILPAGYERQYDKGILPRTVTTGDLFQVPNVVRSRSHSPPDVFFITVRSSADPWLTYMAVTKGSGDFGISKGALLATGVTVVVIGCFGTLLWMVAAFYGWRMLCSRHKPTSRPAGVSGYAWDLANRYGGSYAPALGVPVHGTGQDGMPIAQPMYMYPNQMMPGQPVTGYPPYGYQPPYGVNPTGPYNSYAYPSPYPPPGGNVEMNPYSYPVNPAVAPGIGGPEAQPAGAPAPYPYPYAYPYPPYAGAPPIPLGSQPAAAAAGGGILPPGTRPASEPPSATSRPANMPPEATT